MYSYLVFYPTQHYQLDFTHWKYEGCSEINAPHSFLGYYLLRMYEIHAQYNWMFPLHRLFIHTIFKSTALHQHETRACMPCLYQLVSCSHSHVLTARIMLSSSSNLVPRSAFFSGPKGWKTFGPVERHHQ